MLTRDLDLCAVLTEANVEKLRHTLRDLNPTHRFTSQRLSFLDNPDPGVPLKNLYLQTELGPVDILGSILGVGDFERVRLAAIEIELFGRRCRVISLQDLITAKEALGREKDLLAVKELRAIAEKAQGTRTDDASSGRRAIRAAKILERCLRRPFQLCNSGTTVEVNIAWNAGAALGVLVTHELLRQRPHPHLMRHCTRRG